MTQVAPIVGPLSCQLRRQFDRSRECPCGEGPR